MPGGASFTSDQSVKHSTATEQMVPTSRRARLTSIQAKGNSTDGSIIFRTGGATGTIIATYLFGEEGLDMYLPGSGIFFKEGIHATIANTAGVTITFT
ncbi:hypothetical protein [Hyphomonas sp.]|uniref:hypothetical protein n=1 Tax=Hyphomonas sp. TaxID=87 RepID=UPI0025C2B526|nr:hypothetical protein [Hyphomonas sp.]|tara:strand:+ start:376 stop:669 length:294 start_codon:yes stop_codon:yes gene_type:complete